MEHTKQFIEDAIEGGWQDRPNHYHSRGMNHSMLLLDPLAWQAVGKTRGWSHIPEGNCCVCGGPMEEGEKMFKFHGSLGPCPKPRIKNTDSRAEMIKFCTHLADGKSIEEALGAIN